MTFLGWFAAFKSLAFATLSHIFCGGLIRPICRLASHFHNFALALRMGRSPTLLGALLNSIGVILKENLLLWRFCQQLSFSRQLCTNTESTNNLSAIQKEKKEKNPYQVRYKYHHRNIGLSFFFLSAYANTLGHFPFLPRRLIRNFDSPMRDYSVLFSFVSSIPFSHSSTCAKSSHSPNHTFHHAQLCIHQRTHHHIQNRMHQCTHARTHHHTYHTNHHSRHHHFYSTFLSPLQRICRRTGRSSARRHLAIQTANVRLESWGGVASMDANSPAWWRCSLHRVSIIRLDNGHIWNWVLPVIKYYRILF